MCIVGSSDKIDMIPRAIDYDMTLRERRVAFETNGGWLLRPFTLAELVNVGVYVFINHRLRQYYVGQATVCFGTRFLREIGRRLAGERTTAGYDLIFEHQDTEVLYVRSYLWTQVRRCNLDDVEADVFKEYQEKYTDYMTLNKRSVKKWNSVQTASAP
jgi:hypothetical protein